MTIDRRAILSTTLGGIAIAAAASRADAAPPAAQMPGTAVGLVPDTGADQTAALQAAIDNAAERKTALVLTPGRYLAGRVTLRAGTQIIAGNGTATLALARGGPLLTADNAAGIRITGLAIDGGMLGTIDDALVALTGCADIALDDLHVSHTPGRAILLDGCTGRVTRSRIAHAGTGIHSLDGSGIAMLDNVVEDCANNAIQVWRRANGADGSIVSRNRIARVAAKAGGSGQNGNGVSVFRAGGVLVEGNRIADCAYSAVRANAASNIQIVANTCERIGEVALYAEFGFEGALIASNVIDHAASGISVTNFDRGGRLAVVQGNLVRNLVRREAEPTDKRGEGIIVEADASVTGNTIENAQTAGIVIGWGRFMRDCVVTGNLVRASPLGILVSADADGGACLIASNMISGAKDGAIRAHDHGRSFGADLVRDTTDNGRVRIAGNVGV
jgi:uncharacterized secreted repeat protein (TIGR03808 family)